MMLAKNAAVTIDIEITGSIPRGMLNAYPIAVPENIRGKKCPPLRPVSMQTFVRTILSTLVKTSAITPAGHLNPLEDKSDVHLKTSSEEGEFHRFPRQVHR